MCGSLALGGVEFSVLRLGKVRCVVFSRECLDGKVLDVRLDEGKKLSNGHIV